MNKLELIKIKGIYRYLALYTISGFVVVGLETVWIRALSLIIGNTVAAATAVICVFFLFAAFGNLLGGILSAHTKKSALFYGFAEIGFALSALLLYPFASHLPLSNAFTGSSGLLNIILSTVILVGLPSLFAGISLPLLLQTFVWRNDSRTSTGGILYAGNLFGAAAGVICAGILLPMQLGFSFTFKILAILGIAEGLMAALWNKKVTFPEKSGFIANVKKKNNNNISLNTSGYGILALSGFLSLGIELLLLQYFRQFSSGSLYTVSAVLFAFLIGISGGSLCASLAKRTKYNAYQLLKFFLWISALMCALYILFFHTILERSIIEGGLIQYRGTSMGLHAMWTIIKTTLIVFPLLIVTGTIFPLAWEITGKDVMNQGSFFGKAIFVNKIGCALGAVIMPFILVPWIGLSGTLFCIGIAFLTIVLILDSKKFLSAKIKFSALAIRLIAVCILAFVGINLKPVLFIRGNEKLLDVYQGAGTTTAVVEDANNSKHIIINQHYILNGTQKALITQQNESWLPLSLCNSPEQVAFIGVASGISANAALDFPIKKLEAIEIIPDVVKAAQKWFSPWNKALFNDARSSVIIQDGRRIISASNEFYDCIICDLVLPCGESTNDLYSLDFFIIAKGKLTSQGIFCLWLPLYQMDEELAGMVIKTFTQAFPYAIAIRGNLDPLQNTLGLIGSNSLIDISSETISKRLSTIPPSVSGQCNFLQSEANFRLIFVADLTAVKNNFSGFTVVTDNNPVFSFQGPKQIENGKTLRALTFLRWTDKVFPPSDLPSCNLGSTIIDSIQNGRRAGNYYFAASINNLSIPGEKEKQAQRYVQMLKYIGIAKELSPLSKIDFE